jgi:hypothetical protein
MMCKFACFSGYLQYPKMLELWNHEVHPLTSDSVHHVFILFGAFTVESCKIVLFGFAVVRLPSCRNLRPAKWVEVSFVLGMFTEVFFIHSSCVQNLQTVMDTM